MNEYVVTIGNSKRNVVVSEDNHLMINEEKFEYELTSLNSHTYLLKLNDRVFQVSAEKINSVAFSVYLNGRNIEVIVRSALQEKAIKLLEQSQHGKIHKTEIRAPMPGMILRIKKAIGEEVLPGESIVILEAMKMENNIHSPASGIIKSISVKEGSAVEKGAILFSIE